MTKALVFLSFALLVAFAFVSCSKKGAVAEPEKEQPSITVTNTSVVTLTADQVSFDVTIRERGDDVDKLTDSGNIRSNKVKAALRKLGIENMATRQFSITPYYSYIMIDKKANEYDRENERKEYRYHEYLHTFTVKMENVDKNPDLIGKAIDCIMSIGDAEISNITYSITDNRKANASVRRASAQAVMRKINSYADGCGVKVKGIRNMHEGAYTRDTGVVMANGATANRSVMKSAAAPMMEMAMADLDDAKDASTQITSDKIGVDAEVDYTASLGGSLKNKLNVRGFSEIKAVPDVAEFMVTVRISGDRIPDLVRESANIIKGICQRLNGECDMTTVQYSVSPYFISDKSSDSQIWHSDKANVLSKYDFTHGIRVKVMDFDKDNKLGRVIDLVKKNTDERISIGSVTYSISDNTKYADEARKGATANGKEKCEIYADGAGAKTSGVFSIVENYSVQDTDINGDELYYGKSGKRIYNGNDIADGQTVIFRDKVSVRAQLTVTVDI